MSIDNVQDITPRVQYVATAGQTEFPYPFPIFDEDDLRVYVDGTLQTKTTDYTVSGVGNDNGGTVTFTSALSGDEVVTIYRETEIARTTDFQQNGPWRSTSTNDELDRITVILQELKAEIGRCLRFPKIATVASDAIELGPIANWLGRYVYINSSGQPEPAVISETTVTQSIIGSLLYPQTQAESAASVTPVNLYIPSHDAIGYALPARYGAKGDGVADDTNALNDMFKIDCPCEIPDGTYRVTGPLTRANGQPIYMHDDANIVPVDGGSRYTVLTVNNPLTCSGPWKIYVNRFVWSTGDGDAARKNLDGVHFTGACPAIDIESIDVRGLDGFGIRLTNVWDSRIGNLLTDGCGNSTSWAIWLDTDGDDNNFYRIDHIQPENSFEKALKIGTSRSAEIGVVHMEYAVVAGDTNLVEMTGQFNIGAFNWLSNDPGRVYLDVEACHIGQFMHVADDDASANQLRIRCFNFGVCAIDAIQTFDAGGDLLIVAEEFSDGNGHVTINSGHVDILRPRANWWNVNNVRISSRLDMDFSEASRAQALKAVFSGCTIADLNASQNTSAASFRDCHILDVTNLPGYTIIDHCQVTADIELTGKRLEVTDSVITGDLTVFQPLVFDMTRVYLNGDLIYTGGATFYRHCFNDVQISGAIASEALTAPTVAPDGLSNTHMRPVWTAGEPIGWKWNGTAWVAGPDAPTP